MKRKVASVLKKILGSKTTSSNKFKERFIGKDDLNDQKQWNGGRYLKSDDFKDLCKRDK